MRFSLSDVEDVLSSRRRRDLFVRSECEDGAAAVAKAVGAGALLGVFNDYFLL